jgi:hypothetical protein
VVKEGERDLIAFLHVAHAEIKFNQDGKHVPNLPHSMLFSKGGTACNAARQACTQRAFLDHCSGIRVLGFKTARNLQSNRACGKQAHKLTAELQAQGGGGRELEARGISSAHCAWRLPWANAQVQTCVHATTYASFAPLRAQIAATCVRVRASVDTDLNGGL